jgi:hypothetical protein
MIRFKLTKEAAQALNNYNLETNGRGVNAGAEPYITDPECIERLQHLSMPGESLSDVIVRLYRQGGALPQ